MVSNLHDWHYHTVKVDNTLIQPTAFSSFLWDGHFARPNQAGKIPAPQKTRAFWNFSCTLIGTVTGADHSDRQNSGIEWKQLESMKGFDDRSGCTTESAGDLDDGDRPIYSRKA
jgi:hypothetical protein